MECGKCGWPIGLCSCTAEDYLTIEDWAVVQAFRRECFPEMYTEFTLKHVPVRDDHGCLMMIPIDMLRGVNE